MGRVFYLGYYDTQENQAENRHYELAAGTKMSYIISAIEACGHSAEIISPVMTRNNRFYKGKVVPIGANSKLRLFWTAPYTPRVARILGRWILKLHVFFYLLFCLKKEDSVIVYHSLAWMRRIRWLKKLRKFRLILEVEEVYGDVKEDDKISDKEMAFFEIADSYIFPVEQLQKKVNTGHKPYAVIHGTYQVEKVLSSGFAQDSMKDKIHCVYAGTFDPRKGGITAISAAEFLPENYHMHIIGFGKPEDVERVKQLAEKFSKTCRCGVSYDGCLKGEEYIRFLQSCQIGLCPQDPAAQFTDTSFPSKILSYMSNGLQVVSVRIPTVEESAVGQYIHFYDESTPEKIAEKIQSVTLTEKSGRDIIGLLAREFEEKLRELLEGV